MYPHWSHGDSGLEAGKELNSPKETEDGNTCIMNFSTVTGTYFRFWVIGIQLWWKDGQHGLAHFSHTRDQLGLDCIRTLKRKHKHHCDWGLLLSYRSTSLPVSKALALLFPIWSHSSRKHELFMIPNTMQMPCKYSIEEIMTRKMSVHIQLRCNSYSPPKGSKN